MKWLRNIARELPNWAIEILLGLFGGIVGAVGLPWAVWAWIAYLVSLDENAHVGVIGFILVELFAMSFGGLVGSALPIFVRREYRIRLERDQGRSLPLADLLK